MTNWSKFWTLKVFKTGLYWLYQTNNPIKVPPEVIKVRPNSPWNSSRQLAIAEGFAKAKCFYSNDLGKNLIEVIIS